VRAGGFVTIDHQTVGASPLETVARSLGVRDVLVLRHVRVGTLALLGGVGLGARWAGNVTVELEREPLLARAWEGEVVRWHEPELARIAGPFFARAATIMRVGGDVVVLSSEDADAVELPVEIVFPVARAATQATGEISAERRLADELAVVTILRQAIDAHQLGDPHACPAIERSLACALGASSVTIVSLSSAGDESPIERLALRVAREEAPRGGTIGSGVYSLDAPAGTVAYLAAPVGAAPVAMIVALGEEQGFTALHVRIMEAVADAATSTVVRSLEPRPEPHRVAAAFATAASLRASASPGDATDVSDLAARIAAHLGLEEHAVEAARLGGMLRDVGTLTVPESVLTKTTGLDEGEWSLVRSHPVVGAEIVGRFPELRDAAPAVLHHHERWDGAGYPLGLEAEMIPVAARIVAAADAYHAILAERPYRPARSVHEALAELEAGAGSQFDPVVIDALAAIVSG
jgi:HD-GYP domain-containing protein (c-di-GMP phosphodiesterase class II)